MRWCLPVSALSALSVALAAGCHTFAAGSAGGDDDDTQVDAPSGTDGRGHPPSTGVFSTSTTNVIVEIDYEHGQEPYTGAMLGFGDTFDPTVTNINRLFSNKKAVTIPKTLAQMQDIGSVADEEITVADLAALATAHRDQHDTSDTKTYYVVFVSGHWADGSGVQPAVLGVSVGDTVVMLKDVIKGTGSALDQNTPRYVEQSTLVHEVSHSIGLVDNGIPMVAPHKDAAHGAHCNNSDCVMYWLNEGSADATSFAVNKLVSGSTILFDDACLADVDALTGGP